jgi:hypothetical protein
MRKRLIELLKCAREEMSKMFREKVEECLAEKGRFNSKTDADRQSIYEVEADYLLDNGVIVPPCKVGDKVYVLGDEYFWEVEVVGYSILTNKWSGVAYEAVQYVYKGEELIHTIYADKWGKEMFPTKAEAEYALKNRRSVSLVNGHIEE